MISSKQNFSQLKSIDQYTVIKQIGYGYQGKVFLCQKSNIYVSIKVYQRPDIRNTRQKQFQLIYSFNHPNILKYIQYRQQSKCIYVIDLLQQIRQYQILIMEYCQKSDLLRFLCSYRRFCELDTKKYFLEIISAVQYIHEKGYAHRDIKPYNILVTHDSKLKLGDFGFINLGNQVQKNSRMGTHTYQAPEIFTGQYKYQNADVYACGIILFMLLLGMPPIITKVKNQSINIVRQIQKKERQQFFQILKSQKKVFWQQIQRRIAYYKLPVFIPDLFKDLVNKMIQYDPEKRIKINDIRKHPWFFQVDTNKQNYKRNNKDRDNQKQINEKYEKIRKQKKFQTNHKRSIENVLSEEDEILFKQFFKFQEQINLSDITFQQNPFSKYYIIIKEPQIFISVFKFCFQKQQNILFQQEILENWNIQYDKINHKLKIAVNYCLQKQQTSLIIQAIFSRRDNQSYYVSFIPIEGDLFVGLNLIQRIRFMFELVLNQ